MKKWKLTTICVIVLLILFVPITAHCNDGGTTVYTSLTYQVIVWHKMHSIKNEDGSYTHGYLEDVDFYIFPFNFFDNVNDKEWDLENSKFVSE